jgi:Flp pilus assembly protein TadD
LFYCLSCVNNPLWCEDSVQKQANIYRHQGFQAQLKDDNKAALSFYRKAVELNPAYSVAYNDLGVIYEKMNLLYEAEKMYLKAIELDPHYVGAYTNLALFYEKHKRFDEAAQLWRKRIELGDPTDTWTVRAKEHLENLSKVDKRLYKVYEETETLQLIDNVKELKSKSRDNGQFAAEVYFARGKEHYERGEYVQALRELHRATNLDPRNPEIEKLLIQTQKRALLMP